MAIDSRYRMSQERLDTLKEELHYLETTREKEVAELIKEARSFGDLSENSEYDEAKNEQGKLYSRIAELEEILLHAVIVDESEMDSDKISIGCRVVVTNLDNGKQLPEYTIVGSQEANVMERKVSEDSPFGKALMGTKAGDEEKFAWIRRLLETQQESDAQDFFHNLKVDMFADEVFVFSPKGDVINLPAGATPIDFAYSIHSAIGNSMVGATVNGRIVNFDYVLQNGDIVDIRTSKNAPGPSRDWLSLAKSGAARTKIKQWFKKERREENIVHGKEQFERELRANGIAPADIMGDEILPLILKRLAFTSPDDLYAAIGYGGVTATRTVNRIRDEILRSQKANQKNAIDRINEAAERRNKRPRHAVHGILVEGLDNCLIKFSRCCTPVPGDSIIGFITRGAGVSIHRTDCENYLASRDNPETAGRWIRVSWAENTTDSYGTTLTLLSAQRSGLVMDVATALNSLNAKVRTLTARDVDSGRSTITITAEVHDLAELRTIISRLSAVRGVIRISRSGASDIAKATANTAELQAEHAKNAGKTKQESKA